jgi:RNA polymerase sigma factor (sigma-70 family)
MISSQFIQSCQSGDENAIQTLIRTYQRAVFQLALSVIDDGLPEEIYGSPVAEAEEATRETFIAALDRLGRYREDTNFETWLYGITIQISRRRARRWKFRRGITAFVRRAWRAVTHQPVTQSHQLPDEWKIFHETPETAGQHATHQTATPEAAHTAATQPNSGDTALPHGDPRILHPGDAGLWLAVRRLDEKLRIPVVLRYYHDYSINDIAHLLHISEGTVHARLDAAREKIALKN